MKRILATLLAVVMLLALSVTAFATDEYYGLTINGEPADGSEEMDKLSLIGEIQVEKNGESVIITFPAGFFTEEELQERLETDEYDYMFNNAEFNDDGTIVCTMTREEHQEMLDDFALSVQESFDEMCEDTENYPNFVSITANDDFTVFDVVCRSESLTFNEMFSVIAFYMYGGIYAILNGEEIENIQINFISETTGEVFDIANSADAG